MSKLSKLCILCICHTYVNNSIVFTLYSTFHALLRGCKKYNSANWTITGTARFPVADAFDRRMDYLIGKLDRRLL